ncbi:uncharacterized protein LOC132574326 [Heteronotia binoei]|uniref:uncharacterized protein LOC132574326 n=1 Tax=Heteronotia binoei TaxID=13085 RepID=UPI00292D91F1|nr:uncharacterized protein LOC132574326 [Heteronotia binoei]
MRRSVKSGRLSRLSVTWRERERRPTLVTTIAKSGDERKIGFDKTRVKRKRVLASAVRFQPLLARVEEKISSHIELSPPVALSWTKILLWLILSLSPASGWDSCGQLALGIPFAAGPLPRAFQSHNSGNYLPSLLQLLETHRQGIEVVSHRLLRLHPFVIHLPCQCVTVVLHPHSPHIVVHGSELLNQQRSHCLSHAAMHLVISLTVIFLQAAFSLTAEAFLRLRPKTTTSQRALVQRKRAGPITLFALSVGSSRDLQKEDCTQLLLS